MGPARRAVPSLLFLLALVPGLVNCSGGPGAVTARGGPPADPAPPAERFPTVEVPEDLDASLPTDPTIRKGRLENGLIYYVRHNAAPEDRAELWLVLDVGSILEEDDQRGLAHFVEHMAFNGTRRFQRRELVDYLESLGMRFGPDVNAYTSFDETVYLLRVPTDRSGLLKRGFQILEDWADGITFDPREVAQERGVMVEEWRLGRGAEGRLIDAQIPVLFADSRYAERLPIGSREVLETAPREAIERFYEDWYRPELMAVIAVGDFDPAAIERDIRERFGRLDNPENPRERVEHEVPGHEETLFATFTDPEMTSTAVSVYTKLPKRPEGTVGDYRRGLVEHLYHGMINDRLYELGHRPDPPFLYAVSETEALVRTADVDQQAAGVPEGGVLEGLEALLAEIERVRRFGFGAAELERAKKSLLRAYERTWLQRANRSSASYAAEYSRNFLDDEPLPGIAAEVELARRYIPEITLDEVNALAQVRTAEHDRVILLTAPEDAAETLPSEDELLAVFEQVRERPLEPHVDAGPEGPLMAEEPTPGTIVSRRELPDVGATEWTLSNGARVVLKPTDFRGDQVLLTGFSPGGHSLVPDEDHLTASYAAEAISLGGLGSHDEIALAKLLAGEVVEIGPYIDELEEGIDGASSSTDVDTLLKLVHLALTEPRLDRKAIRSYKDRLRPLLENRLASPEQVFVEQMYRRLTGDHPRRQPLDPERLEQVDPNLALEVYRERFADASDFTFVLVGAFDPEEIERPVATYLASLPATGREETWRDVGIERPDEPAKLVVRRGIEPKASVWMILGRPAAPGRVGLDERRTLTALGRALELRLRRTMREELGATYSVDVTTELAWRPRPRSAVSIQFGCAPDRSEELIETVRAEIERFQQGRIDRELVTKVREILIRERETRRTDNAFWLGALAGAYRRGEDPSTVLDFESTIGRLDREDLARAARRYLDWERRVVGVLLPEGGGS